MKMPSPAATSAVRPASFKWCCRRGPIASDLLDLRLAEQSGRPEDQHQDENREDRDVLVLAREIAGPEDLDLAGRLGPRALAQLNVVLQQDGHADRRDQRRQLE